MSKDLFTQMREQEVVTLNFLPTKKEIQKSALYFAKNLVEFGEDNLYERFAEIARLKEAITVIETEIKRNLLEENFEAFGVKGTYRNGGAVLNYDEDDVYAQMKAELKAREELLKLAQTQDVFDAYGNEVPKVSKTERKSSLAITF